MKQPPKTITTTEADKLIAQLGSHKNTVASLRNSTRNKLIGVLFLDAGLRVGELSKLKIKDLIYCSEPVGNLVIRKAISKGNRTRTIPLSDRAKRKIENMNIHCWQKLQLSNDDFAFYGNDFHRHLTTHQIWHIICNNSFLAFGREIYPHILRHTFASRLMRITNIRVVQELLGHKNLQTTQIYTHPNSDDLSKAISELNSVEDPEEEKSLQNAKASLADSR